MSRIASLRGCVEDIRAGPYGMLDALQQQRQRTGCDARAYTSQQDSRPKRGGRRARESRGNIGVIVLRMLRGGYLHLMSPFQTVRLNATGESGKDTRILVPSLRRLSMCS